MKKSCGCVSGCSYERHGLVWWDGEGNGVRCKRYGDNLPDLRPAPHALGLELAEKLPDGWTPLEAVVIAKCLDDEGDVNMFHTSTAALNSYEAVGMLRWTSLTLERAITGSEETE